MLFRSIIFLLLAGCPRSPATPETQEPALKVEAPNVEEPAPVIPEEATCMDECMRQNMARAVAIEMIEADCRAQCGVDVQKVTIARDFALQSGKRVSVTGTLRHTEEGTFLELTDQTKVFLGYEGPPHGWTGLVDAEITVEGTIWEGAVPGGALNKNVPHLGDFDAPLPATINGLQ